MVSAKIFGASALLALSGMASAFNAPRGPYMYARAANTTAPTTTLAPTLAPNSTTSTAPTATGGNDSLYCPNLDLQVIVSGSGVQFLLECNTDHFGLKIEIDISKRQAALPTNIGECLDVCSGDDACVAASFNTATQVCSYFETVGAAFDSPNVDFAMKVNAAAAPGNGAGAEPTLAPSNTITGTITQTLVGTVYSCAPTVTDCPYGAHQVTETAYLYTTYCPGNAVTTYEAAALSGCGCAATGVTATVYSPTVATFTALSTTSTIYVPVATNVINYPVGAGSAKATVATTTVASAVGTGAYKTSSGPAQYTGAAGHIEAGMGLAGAAAIMAFVL